jgi:hypothetical protein
MTKLVKRNGKKSAIISRYKKAPAYKKTFKTIKTCRHCGKVYGFEDYINSYPKYHPDIIEEQIVRMARRFMRSSSCTVNHYIIKKENNRRNDNDLRLENHGFAQVKHGYAVHLKKARPTYTTWVSIRQNCYNKNRENYDYYGGKGIKVCRRWKDFGKFIEDMGERPEGCQLTRINLKRNYSKGNCKWATIKELCEKRNFQRKFFNISGKLLMCARDIAEKYNLPLTVAFTRGNTGWTKESFERGRNIPMMEKKNIPLKKIFEEKGEILNNKEKDFISLKIGVDGTIRTLQEVGDLKGVSRQRVEQVISGAVFKMMKE